MRSPGVDRSPRLDLSWRACCLPTSNLQCGTSSPSRSFSVPRSTRKVCKHVPDHLLITDEALSLWMSSLSVAMADPKVAFTFEWTREVVEARGWRYEVATEPSAVELVNVRFLSARGGAQKLIIRSPDPNDIGIHTGCRSGEVIRIRTQRRQSGGACVSGRGGVHGDRDRGADRLFQ